MYVWFAVTYIYILDTISLNLIVLYKLTFGLIPRKQHRKSRQQHTIIWIRIEPTGEDIASEKEIIRLGGNKGIVIC